MAAMVFVVLILAITGHSSANWCVCRDGLGDTVLQKTLDYACGAGADCNPTHQNGVCFSPNTVKAHCSYAVNSYYQKKNQGPGTCDFSGTTQVVTSDPSTGGTCTYPASPSVAGSTTNPVTGTPSTTTPSTSTSPTTGTTPGTVNAPYTATPGVIGGVGNGMGPSAGINTDISHGGFMLQNASLFFSFLIALLFSSLVVVWN